MAANDMIRVMISSRCMDRVPAGEGAPKRLTDVREAIKQRLEAERLCGEQVFRVDITPEHPQAGADESFWEASIEAVRRADIVIVLYNGDAGFQHPQGGGICEAEFNEAISSGASRTHVIILPQPDKPSKTKKERALDAHFADLIEKSRVAQTVASDATAALEKAMESVLAATLKQVGDGSRLARSGKADFGPSLDWSRLGFRERKEKMEKTLLDCICTGGRSVKKKDLPRAAVVPIGQLEIFFVCHAVPAAFSVAAARELVGRPFLQDHRFAELLEKCAGPLHIIACQKTVTEKQATDLLGFPDVTLVKSSFGVYAADPVQKVQVVLLAGCYNPGHTADAVGRFFDWLTRSGQQEAVAALAQARARIVQAIALEQSAAP
jgi:hypothetical protein